VGQIVLLACAAAVFPTLIAYVAVMISRPEPRALLLAFYLGGLISSLTSGVVVLASARLRHWSLSRLNLSRGRGEAPHLART
jgi:hypothetical protein